MQNGVLRSVLRNAFLSLKRQGKVTAFLCFPTLIDRMCLSTFLYFSYGSNLLRSRIHINNPSAVRFGIGKLKDHRLDFNYKSQRWNGAAATIVPEKGAVVWGALWTIHNDHKVSLDDQEGVVQGVYKVIESAEVETPFGDIVKARTYHLVDQPPSRGPNEPLPSHRKPSKVYLDTIIQGAIESGLPPDYIEQLQNIEHNGYSGPIYHKLD